MALGGCLASGCFVSTFLITGVASKCFITAFLCAALVLFFLTFLLSLVTAMMYFISRYTNGARCFWR